MESLELNQDKAFNYPQTWRDEIFTYEYHKVPIHDPYHWLEDPESDATKDFVKRQNRITLPYLESCTSRNAIRERLKDLWNYEKYSCPFKEGDKYYYFKNTGLQDQYVMYEAESSQEGTGKVFIDFNKLSEDGTVALSSYKFSEDGSLLAYALSEKGSDWKCIKFRKVSTNTDYDDALEKVKFSAISWTHDKQGIFYSRYPVQRGKTDGSETTPSQNQKLYYHRLGTPQSEDTLMVEFPEHPKWCITAIVSDCGKFLIIKVFEDCRDNLLFFCNIEENLKNGFTQSLVLRPVVTQFEADYEYITNEGSIFYFRTNKGAPNYQVISMDFSCGYKESDWKTVIAEDNNDVLDWVDAVDGNKLVTCYIRDVKNSLELRKLKDGSLLKKFPLGVGTITGFSGKKHHCEIFYRFESFTTPASIFKVDLRKDDYEPELIREVKPNGFDSSRYVTEQIFYNSKDGTKVPMFIVHRKDIELNGENFCLLYGYGGFNISIQPTFSVIRLIIMENFNGVLAVPNIRGGGEYGEKWHDGGRLLNKQNCFNDFQCAAEFLIKKKYTNPKLLVIQGGSNGGLLVGACINQRPDLFAAGIAQVGVLDMLRFQKFTIGYTWCSDYGNPESDQGHFHNILKYSPLHNVKMPENQAVQYPAVLLVTADHDDRVVPLHSFKFVAELQHSIGRHPRQSNPLLILVDTRAGHGKGKPTGKIIDEYVDIMCFLEKSLGLTFSS